MPECLIYIYYYTKNAAQCDKITKKENSKTIQFYRFCICLLHECLHHMCRYFIDFIKSINLFDTLLS